MKVIEKKGKKKLNLASVQTILFVLGPITLNVPDLIILFFDTTKGFNLDEVNLSVFSFVA